jgi:hypothetical protein
MKFLSFAYLAVFLGVSSAQQITVNYYSDSSCSDFVYQVEAFVGSCYTYSYGGLLIASCPSGCDCTFYADENCQDFLIDVSGTGQCVDGSEINSFVCNDS